ncbi:MAG TPA: tetratricopeptide repeat protein [Phycisphaerae bacterium]|jgi:predicted O-linked N-acetylglucosamine transferase (SPINDLY family)
MTLQEMQQALTAAMEHHQAGRVADAEKGYRQVLAHDPRHDGALHMLGVLAMQVGRSDLAIELIGHAIEIRPAADYYSNLGLAWQAHGDLDQAGEAIAHALRQNMQVAVYHYNMGVVRLAQGRIAEAMAAFAQAVRLDPAQAHFHLNLGHCLQAQKQSDQAVAEYQSAIALKPDFAEAHYNLGNVYSERGDLDEAAAAFRQALRCRPNYGRAHNNLGSILQSQGLLDDALAHFREADRQMGGQSSEAASNLVYGMHFHPAMRDADFTVEHTRWRERHGAFPILPHEKSRHASARLRIGYVSPDFRRHPVGRFLMPLLRQHDRTAFEIYCYSDAPVEDDFTDTFRGLADSWRPTFGTSHEALAAMIRADGVDILVDLTMHTQGNRLPMFARRPAPLQVTYLAYCSSTGLTTIDYRLTDRHLDPPGLANWYTEKSEYLQSYWCYSAMDEAGEPGRPPAMSSNGITFGCLNNFCKVSEGVLETWAAILRVVPASRLVLHARSGGHQGRVKDFFARQGISPERCRFVGQLSIQDYFNAYRGIDIALDTFPFAGGTTSCDALWMGVPVVSLAGDRAVGRSGVSILSQIGLRELITQSTAEYTDAAVKLAADLAHLQTLRGTLRERMRHSRLMDSRAFARDIESAYQRMWHAMP